MTYYRSETKVSNNRKCKSIKRVAKEILDEKKNAIFISKTVQILYGQIYFEKKCIFEEKKTEFSNKKENASYTTPYNYMRISRKLYLTLEFYENFIRMIF